MPGITESIAVTGSFGHADGTSQIVLTERLRSHDTFLSGVLQLGDLQIAVRIITLDDVTVLRPVDPQGFIGLAADCAGVLHLPHGSRRRGVPADLAAAASRRHRALAELDDAELRYALTFLEEATTSQIRQARISAIVTALPEAGTGPAAAATGPARQVPTDAA